MPISPISHASQRFTTRKKMYDKGRPTSTVRGYDARWRKYRAVFLAKHPLCEECKRQGRTKAANVVDHIVPHRGDKDLFWAVDNHRALCIPCHNRKTMLEMRERYCG